MYDLNFFNCKNRKMKSKILLSLSLGFIGFGLFNSCSSSKSSVSNMVARMEVKERIEGVCDNANVIAILPFPGNGQVKANAPMTDEEITELLNSEVKFLDDKLDYEDKGMVSLIINCEGDMVECTTSNKTQSPKLDAQIVAVFSEMKDWKAGTINNKAVDTVVLYSFTITDGEIVL
jgi:hypothetical protein